MQKKNRKNHLVSSSPPLGRGCNSNRISSMAQWTTRRNQTIFAVFDVTLNNGP